MTAAALLLITSAARADSVQELSGPTPFPSGCGVTGTPTFNSTAEPYVVVNPVNPDNIVVTWQQDRFNADGGALSNVVSVSKDGGRSFREAPVPGISRCTGGADERASDPWLSFGPDGTLYLASLSFSEMPQNQAVAGPTELEVSRSSDGGVSWSAPVYVQPLDQTYNDREAIAADPTRPGYAYFAFVKRYGAEGESGFEQFSRTTDGGRTWSSPAPIYTPPPGVLTDPTLIEVLPDGTLVNLLIVANLSPFLPNPAPKIRWDIMAQRSTDQGQTWSGAVKIADIAPFPPIDSDTGKVVRAYPVISGAVGPDGTTYVVWNEIPVPGLGSQVLFAKSADGGRTWSNPALVKRSPGQAFLPSVAVAGDGTLGVTYDDTRNNQAGSKQLTTDVWFSQSRDRGATWQESHVAGPFATSTAPESDSSGVQGLFLGDYQGLAALGHGGFGAAFAQSRPQATHGPSDLFFAALGTAGGAAGGEATRGRGTIDLTAAPARARAGRRTAFRFLATTGPRRAPVGGARILFAGRRTHTNAAGRARLRIVVHRSGRRHAVALRGDLARGVAYVCVRPRLRRARGCRTPATPRPALPRGARGSRGRVLPPVLRYQTR
ncbi:MAG TPA: sialidase family protein [Solirubrobacteraceae bacterium]|nr:sialidase family protein [Solirubrobacteraceae bacterium]